MALDAVVVGAGPNGLAAAIELARAGASVQVFEAASSPGGGVRSAALTEPGFLHDVCSTVHPLASASPFFSSLPLGELGISFVHPAAPLAHPLQEVTAFLQRDLPTTAAGLGRDDKAYRKVFGPLLEARNALKELLFAPLRSPRHPLVGLRFATHALRSARAGAESWFDSESARALFSGIAAHSMLPLERVPSAAFGLFLGALGHDVGWPFVLGGSQKLTDGLVKHLSDLGGIIVTEQRVEDLRELPSSRVVLLDLLPRTAARVAGERLPGRYRRRLMDRPAGPGVFKLDWALSEPIPWSDTAIARAGTVHLGGTMSEVAAAESVVASGGLPERPFVILTQPSLFDGSRAPADKHVAWAYCHVPNGSTADMTGAIESQVERFAPGFGDVVLARHAAGPADLQSYNSSYPGGDINGGAQTLFRIATGPAWRWDPHSTPARDIFLCSSATPPGGGVHGMCGFWAARSALKALRASGRE